MILAGGAGTRFWPASRRGRPKPFVPLVGRDTLLEATLRRAGRLAPRGTIWIVGAEAHRRLLRDALRSRSRVRVLLEPVARNTAAAIAWAAAAVRAHDPEGVVAVLPADHHIPDPSAFATGIRGAAALASRRDALVLVGIEPTRPDTAYGYLDVAASRDALVVRRFVEKPNSARARRFARSGHHLWNSGMLVGTSERILRELRAHGSEVWPALGGVLDRIGHGRRVPRAELRAAYAAARSISFDYAVLERTAGVLAVRGRFAWSDLGSWDALLEHVSRGPDGNRVRGARPVSVEAGDNLVWNTSGRTVALLGVEGLIVVETDDAVLVCAPDRAQDVRRVVAALERRGRRELT